MIRGWGETNHPNNTHNNTQLDMYYLTDTSYHQWMVTNRTVHVVTPSGRLIDLHYAGLCEGLNRKEACDRQIGNERLYIWSAQQVSDYQETLRS